jgi:GT2 family glycosyltransferase
MTLKASVIICSYNRIYILPNVLNSLINQTLPITDYEIIVVDDGSEDRTEDLIREYQKGSTNIKFLRNIKNCGLANSANHGIESAATDILLFTDDDCVPAPDWVEMMSQSLTVSPVVAGQILSDDHPYLNLARNITDFHPVLFRENPCYLTSIAGANMGFQRKVFTDVGLFQPNCPTPDTEFLLRSLSAGYRVKFSPECKITHFQVHKTLYQSCKYEASRSSSTIKLRKQYKLLLRTPFVLESPFLLLFLSPFISFFKVCQIYGSNFRLIKYLHTIPVVFLLKMAWCFGAAKGLMQAAKQK